MTTKSKSSGEMVVEFLSEEYVYAAMKDNVRIKKLLLKGGFGDWLLIITAAVDGERVVAFVGANSITGVARKLHQQFYKDGLVWKPDQYAE